MAGRYGAAGIDRQRLQPAIAAQHPALIDRYLAADAVDGRRSAIQVMSALTPRTVNMPVALTSVGEVMEPFASITSSPPLTRVSPM